MIYKKKITVFFSCLLLFAGIIFALRRLPDKDIFQFSPPSQYMEVEQLAAATDADKTFSALSIFFTDLSKKKGAVYAFEVLKRISAPPNIDMHLLGHVVGDELFKQEGAGGIRVCTEDFRNACSHSIVVGLFLEKGDMALSEIAEACRNAPGGKGAYTMCFHGLGHGVLAYAEYNFPNAVRLCRKTGTSEYQNREYAECVGGAVMELIGGGFHNRGLWQKARQTYLRAASPLSLCAIEMIPAREAREFCYVYITPYLFETTGADMGNPTADNFKKAFPYCDAIPAHETVFRDACYRGFGKEFVGLVLGRDIRAGAIESISDNQLLQIYDWCVLAGNREGSAACILHALDSLFWGGENNPAISIKFCTLMGDEYYKRSCMRHLLETAQYYFASSVQKKKFCGEMPAQYQKKCNSILK